MRGRWFFAGRSYVHMPHIDASRVSSMCGKNARRSSALEFMMIRCGEYIGGDWLMRQRCRGFCKKFEI